jgi:4-amino-4-deoxychorismate lyase
MAQCLTLLNIPQPDWKQVLDWLTKAALSEPKAGLRLNITRGEGGRGYGSSGISFPNVVISRFNYPEHYIHWTTVGVELGVCEPRLGIIPSLAGHKHNNRLEQVLAKQDIDAQGLVDGVVLDINDCVIETTMANLFWVVGEKLYTPSLENSGVAGVMRRLILQDAREKGLSVEIGAYRLSELLAADEVFMTNSISCVIPINKIQEKTFEVGHITRDFQEKFSS